MGGTAATIQSMVVLKGILFFPVNVNWCKQWIYAYNINTFQFSSTALSDDNCTTNANSFSDMYRLVSNDGTLWTTNRTGGNPVILRHWDVSIGANGVPEAKLLLSVDLTALTGISCASAPTFVGNQLWVASCWNQSGLVSIDPQTGAISKIVPLPGLLGAVKLTSVGSRIWFFDGDGIFGEFDTKTEKIIWAWRPRTTAQYGDIQGHISSPAIIGSEVNDVYWASVINGELWIEASGFTNTRYLFNVGSISDPTTPTAPTNIKIVPGDTSSLVSFEVPQDDGGTGIKYYTVTANPGGQTCQVENPVWDKRRLNTLTTSDYIIAVPSGAWNPYLKLSCVIPGLTNVSSFEVSVVATSFLGDGQASPPKKYQPRSYAAPTVLETTYLGRFDRGVASINSNGSRIFFNEPAKTEAWDPVTKKFTYSKDVGVLSNTMLNINGDMYAAGIDGINNTYLTKFPSSGGDSVRFAGPTFTGWATGQFQGNVAGNSSVIAVSTINWGLAGISVSTGKVLWTNSVPYWVGVGNPGGGGRFTAIGEYAYGFCNRLVDNNVTYWQFGGMYGKMCKIRLADGVVVAESSPYTDHGFIIGADQPRIVVAAGKNIALATGQALMLLDGNDLSLIGASYTPDVRPTDLVVVGNHIFESFSNSSVIKEFSSLTGAFQSSFVASKPDILLAEHQGDLYVLATDWTSTISRYALPADPVAPSAPVNVTATAGGESAKVSWTTPKNGGAEIDSYTVTATNGFNPENRGQTCVTSTNSCLVTGLTDGEPYTFSVVATNWVGTSGEGVSNMVTPTAQIYNLLVTNGDRSITASWGVSHPSASFAWYNVSTTNEDGTSCVTTQKSCVIRELNNGTSYKVRVEAYDRSGNLASILESENVVPVGRPGVATNVKAMASVSSAKVSFSATNGNGGIVTYRVTSSSGAETCVTSSTSCTVTGLTNGLSYTFNVVAINSFGSGHVSEASNTVIPSLVPAPVTNVQAWGSDSSALVRWDNENAASASTLVSYVVSNGRGDICSTVNTSCVVNGLTNGTSYTFTVTANYDNGSKVVSLPSNSVTPPGVPGVIRNVAVIADNGTLQVSWDPIGGFSLSYVVVLSDGSSCTTNESSCKIGGLINGTSYSLTVYGMDQSGSQWESAAISASPVATSPETPTSVDVDANDGSVTVSWNPADDNGSPITSYIVSDSEGSGAKCVTTALACTITGLTNGLKYSFTVTATNFAGTSAPSTTIQAIPAALPGVPQNVIATPGDRQALVMWQKPFDAGQNTSYEVTAANDSSEVHCITVQLSCIITGLTNGETYTFAVRTLSDTGESVGIALSNGVKPATVPTAPTIINVIAGSTKATVIIGTSKNNGGSQVEMYVVTASNGVRCETTSLTCMFTNLTNGQPLSFTVVAVNGVGESPSSDLSDLVIPQGRPDSPANVKAVSGSGKVTLSWDAPSDNGGSAIKGYQVDDGQGHECFVTGLTCTITGLNNGTRYTFQIFARNDVGSSGVVAISITPDSAPDAVSGVTATFEAATATVRWSAANGYGHDVKYIVTDIFGRKCVTLDLSCRIAGLSFGVPDSFTVVATSRGGVAPPSMPSNRIVPATAPSTPLNINAVAGNGSVTLTWSASVANGSPITSYLVSNTLGDKCETTTLTCTVTGLLGGRSYRFVVQATNIFGISSKSKTASATPASPPAAPLISKATPLSGSAQVYFVPGVATGSAVTSYEYSIDGGVTFRAATWSNGSKSFVITGLVNGTQYEVRIRAVNAMGAGTPSTSKLVTPITTPGAPSLVSVTGGTGLITLTFTSPVNNGGSNVISYSYSIDGGLTWKALPVGSSSGTVSIAHLKSKTTYKVQVRAANAAGSGAPSNSLTVTTKASNG
jgi:hypothetical protein